ncbi:MAG TPA: aspartate racemase [Lachnospiraceae bacterium]|jgi:aspartate racemase|nr:aspartate racemase [Lachnospiraceae bacterium]HCR39757.1 aspartate racemase [Lachnospiraceae bacterium]
MKKLGVIGGLGPLATEYFYSLINKMTDANRDQDHIEMIIYSKPSIPDRTGYILGKSKENPIIPMIEVGRILGELGVDYIAIPCITGHNFYEVLASEIRVPIIHMVKETAAYLNSQGIKSVGIMATEGTIYSKLFQTELAQYGIAAVVPTRDKQEYVNTLIYDNLKVNIAPDMDKFAAISDELWQMGAEVNILGCTELSLIKRDYPLGPNYLDAMEVLAMKSIELCGARVKESYKNLLSM